MSVIAFNQVISIADPDTRPGALNGLYRVIAVPFECQLIWLAEIPKKAKESTENNSGEAISPHRKKPSKPPQPKLIKESYLRLESLEESQLLRPASLQIESRLLITSRALSKQDKALWEVRLATMEPFLIHENLCEALYSSRGLGPMVNAAVAKHGCSRCQVYFLFGRLCLYGFEAGSLNPRFDRCGASRTPRYCGPGRQKAGRKTIAQRLGHGGDNQQVGMTAEMRKLVLDGYNRISTPKLAFSEIYDQIIKTKFINAYRLDENGRYIPVMPTPGTFPNKRQVRYILETGIDKNWRVRQGTTAGHYNRNLRGLHGYAWEGYPGPGFCYAIDSTVGDIYLRSSINRAWFIGRPIVYLLVDVWSTAIVGFYACLTGPKWETAQVALFSTFIGAPVICDLWGYRALPGLNPEPTAPSKLICDRGEYLSENAGLTYRSLGIHADFNPSYRPDLKGCVEVVHRIAKDEQFRFAPGAIDKRRKELELRTDIKESAYTLREYMEFLSEIFSKYNLCADREHRLTGDMIAAGVHPCPAGLWRYGHECRFGYRKPIPDSRLITSLLPRQEAVVTRKGIFFGALQYDFSLAEQEGWTAIARHSGSYRIGVHVFPGSTSRIWWPDPQQGEIHTLTISPHARASGQISHDEWLDAYIYDKCQNGEREYQRLFQSISASTHIDALNERAIEQTRQAEEAQGDIAIPSVRSARMEEVNVGKTEVPEPTTQVPAPSVDERYAGYFAAMGDLISRINDEVAAS